MVGGGAPVALARAMCIDLARRVEVAPLYQDLRDTEVEHEAGAAVVAAVEAHHGTRKTDQDPNRLFLAREEEIAMTMAPDIVA